MGYALLCFFSDGSLFSSSVITVEEGGDGLVGATVCEGRPRDRKEEEPVVGDELGQGFGLRGGEELVGL